MHSSSLEMFLVLSHIREAKRDVMGRKKYRGGALIASLPGIYCSI
jgi:hypothetical protein